MSESKNCEDDTSERGGILMQNYDQYRLLYNNLWLHKETPGKTLVKSAVKDIALSPAKKNNCKVHEIWASESTKEPVSVPTELVESLQLIDSWDVLVGAITNCAKCDLCHSRQNVVIERGSRTAAWMFIGEGPGEAEDIQGKPFVGASGQLLQKMIAAMQLDPVHDVYICNVVKCRPPANRNPEVAEIELCKNYLFSQIELVKPKIIVTLGRFAYQTLLNTTTPLGRLRQKQHYYQTIPVVVTYHPAYLLRNPSAKKDAWADLKLALELYPA